MIKYCFAVFLFCLVTTAVSQVSEEGKHPIDAQFEECKGGNTVEMLECAAKEYEAWDKEMNKYYKLLMGRLKADEKQKLKSAQKKWLEYRDTETEFYATVNRNKDGTMWPVIFNGRKTGIVRQRALDLIEYYEIETMGD